MVELSIRKVVPIISGKLEISRLIEFPRGRWPPHAYYGIKFKNILFYNLHLYICENIPNRRRGDADNPRRICDQSRSVMDLALLGDARPIDRSTDRSHMRQWIGHASPRRRLGIFFAYI